MKSKCILIIGVLITFSCNLSASDTKEQKAINTLNSDRTQFKFETSEESSKVSLSLLNPVDSRNAFNFTFSGTVGDDDDSKDFVSFDGLEKGVKVKVTYLHFRPLLPPGAPADFNKQKERLDNVMNLAQNAYTTYLDGLSGIDVSQQCLADAKCKRLKDAADDALSDFNSYKARYTGAGRQAAWWIPEQYFLSIAANRDDFTVLNLEQWVNELDDESGVSKEDETGIEIGAALQWLTHKNTRLKIGYDFQRVNSQGGTSLEYCKTEPMVEGVSQCITGNTSLVAEKYNRNLYFHWGGYSSKGILKGWDLRATHNFSDSKTQIEIPLYFYANKKGEVNAGLQFQFLINGDDDEDDAGVKVFFSTPLSIFS